MLKDKNLPALVEQLVDVAYPELKGSNINARWGRTSCFATVSWTSDRLNITITCNIQTKKWHEAALLGLLSHELSHPALGTSNREESSTDIDVIRRGLGPYLAVERAMTDKHEDSVISRGKDKYLGYKSIRANLNEEELIQLDALLQEMRLVPQRYTGLQLPHHDLTIIKTEGMTDISIDGNLFSLEGNIEDSQVEIITRDGISYVFLNGKVIGKYKVITY